jgi:hypothetical protein
MLGFAKKEFGELLINELKPLFIMPLDALKPRA